MSFYAMQSRFTRSRAAMGPPRISIVGGINMDIVLECERIPDQGESMDSLSMDNFHGGKGANTAIAAFRASHKKPTTSNAKGKGTAADEAETRRNVRIYMNGAVGDDDFGHELRESLEQEGIDVSGVQITQARKSGACVVLVEIENGESRNIGHPGANLEWIPKEPNSVTCFANGERPDLIVTHLDNPRERIERVLETASRRGIDTLLNPSPAYYLVTTVYRHVTHLVLNETEAAMLSGHENEEYKDMAAWQTVANYFLTLGVTNVVLTLGVKGAYYATAAGPKGLIKAVQNVDVKDSTGAG